MIFGKPANNLNLGKQSPLTIFFVSTSCIPPIPDRIISPPSLSLSQLLSQERRVKVKRF